MKINCTKVRYAAYALALFVIHGKAILHDIAHREDNEIERIQKMPVARCESELIHLQAFHAQTLEMTEKERWQFFQASVKESRARGLQLPPPPAPVCGRIEHALADCAGVTLHCEAQVAAN